MKKIIGLIAFFIITMVSFTSGANAAETVKRIGLQDRVLDFKTEEIIEIEQQVYVPFEKMASYLDSQIFYSKDNNVIAVYKNNNMITYNKVTGITAHNEKPDNSNPIRKVKNELFVSVHFIAKTTGFSVDHIEEINTLRLTMPASNTLSREEYRNKFGVTPNETSKQPPSGPTVYLTFDDGPNEFTRSNMDILKSYGVKGTFFFVGGQINHFPDLVKATANEGHAIGVHSMTHDKSKVYASTKNFMEEMNTARDLIQKLTDNQPVISRAPYGSKPYVTADMRSELTANGYKLWDWDVDSNDWRYKEADYKKIITNVKEGVNKSRKSKDPHIVILLHDRAQTVKAMPEIVDWLKQEGFQIEKYEPSKHVVQNFWQDKSL